MHAQRNLGLWSWIAIGAALAAPISACKQLPMCGPPGQTQACTCSDSRAGAQVCLPERVWDKCDCTGAIRAPDASTTMPQGADAAATVSSGGSAAPALTSDASTAKTTMTSDASTSADSGAVMTTPVHDGGTPLPATDGGPSDGGHADAATVKGDAYKACSGDTDCTTGGKCNATANLITLGTSTACAPACTTADNCPKPSGNYDATLTCTTDHQCRFDCTPPFLGTAHTCPGTMTCVAGALGSPSYCYAN